MSPEIDSLRDRLRAAVPVAMKARDRRTVSALRSALAAIENAEAVDVGDGPRAGAIEASAVGVGSTEAPRRALSEAEIAAIVQVEIAERRSAAAGYEAAGHADRAADLVAEADALAEYLR
ncbi:MAG TPA: hypothetical protein VGX23_11365 [Actinocrinis sp.]|nr:hypothetical protein [Actinocrinis sp.]